jgi:hypothetical protein
MNRIEPNPNNLLAEESIKSSYGLVAFFDIMGYRQIIANNEIKEAALIIKKALKKITEFQKAADYVEKELKFSPTTNYLAFSDSILIYTSYSEDVSHRKMQAGLFAAGCAGLCGELFEAGLPARGAIAKGEFFIEQTSFAGKAIVEAYEFANSLEFTGCVIVPTAEIEFAGISDPLNLLFPYPVPLKGNQKQNLLTLNLCSLLVINSDNSRQFTIEQFSRHNKNICPETVGKINNTVSFLEQATAAVRKLR